MSDNLPSPKRTIPVSKAASYLGVSAETLRRWDRKGSLKPFRTKGGQRRYSIVDLEAYKSGERRLGSKLSISQAADQLGVHPETLRRWERSGSIQPERTDGGQRRYTLKSLEQISNPVVPHPPLPPLPPAPPPLPSLPALPPPPPKPLVPPPQIPVRSMEHFRPRPRFAVLKLLALTAGLLFAIWGWGQVPPLAKSRLYRSFEPSVAVPIVDVNDVMEYKLSESFEILGLRFKFPVDLPGLVTQSLSVLGDSVLNGARFLGTIFFGEGNDYFITPTGDASFNSIAGLEGEIMSLEVENLTVTGTTTGVAGTGGGGGGGGIATGGDADTLEGRAGAYYLDLDNEVGTCSNCLTTIEIDESTLSISAANADTLDLLDSLQFLRSDTSDSFTSGTLTIADGTTLLVNSSAITIGNTAADTVTFNGVIASDLIPSAGWDIGSAALRWGTGYFDTVDANTIAGTITGSGTDANSWTINQDNLTANAQVSSLAFDTGTATFNAVLQWNAAGDPGRFTGYDDNLLLNYPLSLFSQVSGGNQTFTSGSLFNYGQDRKSV